MHHKAKIGRYFEDFKVGDVFEHAIGRTISESDCTWFTQLTCNTNQSHFNSHFAKSNPISKGKIIVNSGLTVAIVLGMSVLDMSQNAVANLGWDNISLTHPVFVGDTLYAESIVTGLRTSDSYPAMGIVSMFTRGINQDGVEVINWKRAVMIPKLLSGIGQDYFPKIQSGKIEDHANLK